MSGRAVKEVGAYAGAGLFRAFVGYRVIKNRDEYFLEVTNGSVVIFRGPIEFTEEKAEREGRRAILEENPTLAKNIGIAGVRP